MQDDHILSVSALTSAIKGTLEGTFPFVWVRGQVTNCSRPSSGHVYFSLRDENSSISAVWFKGSQKTGERFDPLTGEVYEEGPKPCLAATLEDGQDIVCAGRINVYPPRGVYQLVVELAQDVGLGRLHEEFERLRAHLARLGYFSLERKRPLPRNPQRVAVITAPQGAAVHDFLRIANSRGLGSCIRIYPVPVQGDSAPPAIIGAMQRIIQEQWAEVIVLIRGGGSLEDLWAFNSERLATQIFTSPLPILAGIGHEVDVTLADMTADLRAATPTHAAQLLWPEKAEFRRTVSDAQRALCAAAFRLLQRQEETVTALYKAVEWHSPRRALDNWEERLASALRALRGESHIRLERQMMRFGKLATSLDAVPPSIPLLQSRLSTITRRLDELSLQSLHTKDSALAGSLSSLLRLPGPRLERKAHALEKMNLRLEALDPHAPLERGYALVVKENGTFVKTVHDVTPGEPLRLAVSDGHIPVRVEGVTE